MSLPFTLAPYHDELFGSWLARNELHNGQGAWHALLRDVGIKSSETKVFDIPDFTPALDALIKLLGAKSYEQVLLERTTLPYWLAFDAGGPAEGILPGTEALPILCGDRGQPIRKLAQVAQQYRAAAGIRFCPECLSCDVQTAGEPYWHRVHQLPNVMCCPEHSVRLLSACPRCGRSPTALAEGVIKLLRMTCICGYDLSASVTLREVSDVRGKLMKVSADALVSGTPICTRAQMRAFLRTAIGPANCRRVMQDAYGEFLTGDRYTLKNAVTEADMVWIPEVEKFQNYRSVQCCALLAALNIEFETASQCSSKFKVRAAVSKNRKNSLSSAAPSVSNSRAFLLQRASENRWISSGDNGALHYWNVRLRDSSWLRRHFPHSHAFPAAPTVNADRASIRQLLKRPYASRGTKTDLIKPAIRSRAGVRARIRDSIWLSDYCAKLSQNACLDERRQEVEQPGPSSARTNAKRYQTAQTAVIRDALRSALAADGFPAAISYAELGNRARLSVAMIKVTLKFDHELSQQVRSARLALPQRRVVWAVQELRSMNRTPSTSAVMRLAHVKRSKSMRALIQRSLEDKLEK